jgi:hypothetical protein
MIDWFSGEWTDKDLRDRIKMLPKFRSLMLEGSGLTDEGLRILASTCENLRELQLINTSVTDAGLKSVGTITTLDWLVVDNARITDKGLHSLTNLKNLHGLQIIDGDFSDDGLSILLNYPNLGYLETAGQSIHGRGLSTISACPSLSYFRIACESTCDDDFRNLVFARSLTSLSFDCPLVSSEAVEEVVTRLPGCLVYPFRFYSRGNRFLFLPLYCLDLYEKAQFEFARNIAAHAVRRFPYDPAMHGARAFINLQLDNLYDFQSDLHKAYEMAQMHNDRELLSVISRCMNLRPSEVRALLAEERPERLIRERFRRMAGPQKEPITSLFAQMRRNAIAHQWKDRITTPNITAKDLILPVPANVESLPEMQLLIQRYKERMANGDDGQSNVVWRW